MPALPPSSDFTGASVTEGQFKTALTSLRGFLADLLGTTGTQAAALAALGSLSGSKTVKSANYTVVAADRGKVIECTATLTLSFSAAATLGDAFSFIIMNSGSGTVTLDPSGSETIDDKATITVAAGKSVLVVGNGAEFYTVGADSGGGGAGIEFFTSSGSFTVPEGVTSVKVTVVGGGGGGSDGSAATSGGTSSFGAHCSATGGAGAPNVSTTSSPGSGGTGSGGDINVTGQRGVKIRVNSVSSTNSRENALGGSSPAFGAGQGGEVIITNAGNAALCGGSAGGMAVKKITGLTPGESITVTIGSAGANNTGGFGDVAPTAGIVVVEY